MISVEKLEEERLRLVKYTEDKTESIEWVKENMDISPCNIFPLIKHLIDEIEALRKKVG